MTIDNHSIVFYINEEYGVVIGQDEATGLVAMWDRKKECFARRVSLELAEFLKRFDRVGGKWCEAHPTCSRATAERAAYRLTPRIPGSQEMEYAKNAKRRARLCEIHSGKKAEDFIREAAEEWRRREAL